MTIDEKLEVYKAKLLAEEAAREDKLHAVKDALQGVCDAIDALPDGRDKNALKPLYGRAKAFIENRVYFTRQKGGKGVVE